MGSPVARRTRSSAARASWTAGAPAEPAAPPAGAAPPTAACHEPQPSGGSAGAKRTRPLSEDDYSCPVCLNLLVDPVVGACGHDFCELCYWRWAVDQGKGSCPACRQALAPDLPGICLRLQRTLEALFPQRIKERQAEVEEERRALAAEKKAKEEARRRQEAQRQEAQRGNDLFMQSVLEQLFSEPIFRRPAPGSRAAVPHQQQQQAQAAQQAPAVRVQGTWPPTQQQQAGRLVQRRYPARAAAAPASQGIPPQTHQQQQQQARAASAGMPQQSQARFQAQQQQQQGGFEGLGIDVLLHSLLSTLAPSGQQAPRDAQQAAPQQQHRQQHQQQQHEQQQQLLHSLLSTLAPSGQQSQRGAQQAAPQQQQQQQRWSSSGTSTAAPVGGQLNTQPQSPPPQQQQPHQPQVPLPPPPQQLQQRSFEVRVFHIHAHTPGQATPGAHVQGPSAAHGSGPAPQGAAAWPMGPPLDEMQFCMGWHDAREGQARRRRQLRSSR